MGITFAEREPHGLAPYMLLALLLLGVGSFWLSRRFPRSVWLTLPLLSVLVFVPVVNLIDWLFTTAEADYTTGVHVVSAIEAIVIVLSLALPVLGARHRQKVGITTSRLTTR